MARPDPATDDERRPDPESLLEESRQERRGKLVVFLGAAPGVGKTYSMLEAARERKAEGVDVVAGWVQTHGRAETEALLEGLERIPPRTVEYRGHRFEEMDLDALLARRPQLALVDELAHTNVPGSRHPKRYQDVEELLDAGIDVYTTLNVQHLESLNDLVTRITGVPVRETVPDRIVDQADQIQVVDVPVEELIQRLREGKVYFPEKIEAALHHFFRPGNINALRELTLRRAAERIDEQLARYMQRKAIRGPWPVGDRVLVCVSPSPFASHLIRVGYRFAQVHDSDWLVAYVDVPRTQAPDEAARSRLASHLRLAETLGAQVVVLSGEDVAGEIVRLARERNVGHLIIGRPLRPRWAELFRRSLVDRVIRQSAGIIVHVVPGEVEEGPASRAVPPAAARTGGQARRLALEYGLPAAMVGALTAVVLSLRPALHIVNVALLYLLPVILSAWRLSFGSAIFAAVLAAALFDLLFIEPLSTLWVGHLQYVVSLAMFLMVSVLISSLSARLRGQAENARRRERRTAALLDLSREITALRGVKDVVRTASQRIGEILGAVVEIFVPGVNLGGPGASPPPAAGAAGDGGDGPWLADPKERAMVEWVLQHGLPAGPGTGTFPDAPAWYVPLQTARGVAGVMRVKTGEGEQDLLPEQRRMLEALASLTAVAIERTRLAEAENEARLAAESERVRTALLNAISHELRTPLAFIIGAATTLSENGGGEIRPPLRKELLASIQDEAMRLNRMVEGFLDMSRLEGGLVRLHREWYDVDELVGGALQRLGSGSGVDRIAVQLPDGLPLVQVDGVLASQAIANVLDNALRYSPPGTPVEVRAGVAPGDEAVWIDVADRGPGLRPEARQALLGETPARPSAPGAGLGIGLQITRAIVTAHGGSIQVRDNPGGGCVVRLRFPAAPGAGQAEGGPGGVNGGSGA
ncbi:MAG: sensor histidine kinase KdpD [Limnochordaceae bacterium]|nr:sensor histidine kinase KdpD [Limnochordaceae bacterium]